VFINIAKMDTMYKQFNIDGSTYIFCVEDFEILKISENGKKESILQEIKNKKAKSEKNIDELQKYESGYAKSTNINTIGVNLVNGCNLNCTYCYISASSKKKRKSE
jgi:sulfatase maturation enzyme AslB (radical SAM superfamily)